MSPQTRNPLQPLAVGQGGGGQEHPGGGVVIWSLRETSQVFMWGSVYMLGIWPLPLPWGPRGAQWPGQAVRMKNVGVGGAQAPACRVSRLGASHQLAEGSAVPAPHPYPERPAASTWSRSTLLSVRTSSNSSPLVPWTHRGFPWGSLSTPSRRGDSAPNGISPVPSAPSGPRLGGHMSPSCPPAPVLPSSAQCSAQLSAGRDRTPPEAIPTQTVA